MLQFIPVLLQWFAPATIAFFTPARCMAVFEAIVSTIKFINESHGDLTNEQQYPIALAFLIKQYDLLDSVVDAPDTVDQFMKDSVFPTILTFVYGSAEHV